MRDIRFNTNEQENNTDQHPHSQLPENTNPHETSMSSSVINAGQNKSEQGDLGITQRNSTHCSDRKRKLVENSRWECRISAQNLMKEGDSVPENYEACVSGCESEESAKQEAALKLLRLYEGAQMALFKEGMFSYDPISWYYIFLLTSQIRLHISSSFPSYCRFWLIHSSALLKRSHQRRSLEECTHYNINARWRGKQNLHQK